MGSVCVLFLSGGQWSFDGCLETLIFPSHHSCTTKHLPATIGAGLVVAWRGPFPVFPATMPLHHHSSDHYLLHTPACLLLEELEEGRERAGTYLQRAGACHVSACMPAAAAVFLLLPAAVFFCCFKFLTCCHAQILGEEHHHHGGACWNTMPSPIFCTAAVAAGCLCHPCQHLAALAAHPSPALGDMGVFNIDIDLPDITFPTTPCMGFAPPWPCPWRMGDLGVWVVPFPLVPFPRVPPPPCWVDGTLVSPTCLVEGGGMDL